MITKLLKAIGAVTMTPLPVDPENETNRDMIRRWAQTQSNAPALLSEANVPHTYSALAAPIDDIRAVLDPFGLVRWGSLDREDGSDSQWETYS